MAPRYTISTPPVECSGESTPKGVFWVNSAGRVHQVDRRLCRWLGYAERELTALSIWDLIADWSAAQWPDRWRRFRRQAFASYQAGLAARSGKIVPVEIEAGLLNAGAEELMCGFVRRRGCRTACDPSVVAELKASAERLRLVYDNAPVMLQVCDADTRIVSVNRYWLETLGYRWEEVKGRQTLEFMTPSARKDAIHKVIPSLLRTGTMEGFEYQLVKKSGERIDVALTAVSELDAHGRIVQTLSMILPISDRKRAERLESQNFYLRSELVEEFNSGEIIGASAAMWDVFKSIEMVAGTETTVLLLGETGTGKELVARAIHRNSRRRDGVMVKVNCGALPSGLVESELFGHEKGAFTGATARKKGRFELAHDSTIFLDEVGELPPETQTKLLRVLQEQEFERLGGSETVKINVRVIAATNRDLEEEVKMGRFRADLFYRLHIFPVRIPPLRERIEDIPLLANHFVKHFAARFGKKTAGINRRAIEKLIAWEWPGNVRELANILERGVILCNGLTLQEKHIGLSGVAASRKDRIPTLEESERRLILQALKTCNGRLSGPRGAAAMLGINRSTLWSRMRKLGIDASRAT